MIPFICPTCGQFDLENSTCSSCSSATADHTADMYLFGDPGLRLFGGAEKLPPATIPA